MGHPGSGRCHQIPGEVLMARNPTDRQRQCWEALNAHRNVRSAADSLGMAPYSLRDGAEAYMRKAGIPGPLPFTKVYRSRLAGQELEDARRRIAQLETENAALRGQVDGLRAVNARLAAEARPWAGVHARLERIERAVTRPTVITHRRVADGGMGGRRERRAA